MLSVFEPAGTATEKRPSMSVTPITLPPLTATEAPITGSLSPSTTVPLQLMSPDAAMAAIETIHIVSTKERILFIANLFGV